MDFHRTTLAGDAQRVPVTIAVVPVSHVFVGAIMTGVRRTSSHLDGTWERPVALTPEGRYTARRDRDISSAWDLDCLGDPL